MNAKIMKDLLDVAKGRSEPDLVIRNGRLINVFTNTVEENTMVAIKGGYVVAAEREENATFAASRNVLDAKGLYLCPGFIDAHTHLDSMHSFPEFVPYALKGGATTVVSETSGAACACGMEGVEAFMASTREQPVRCYFVIPPLTPPFPSMEGSRGLTLREFQRLLKRDDCVGVGEAYWTRVVDGESRILKQAAMAWNQRKALDGHAAGARGMRLQEYALTGITSCHESVTIDEVLEKLRLGIYVMIRQGWVRKELPELWHIKDLDVDKRRVMLVSDVFDAVMLVEEGYLDSIVREAIAYGFDPVEAIKMVTINPADYYGLRHLGAIAPLRRADILFLRSIERVSIEMVMANGHVVVDKGNFVGTTRQHEYPASVKQSISVGSFSAVDFRIKAQPGKELVRVIEVANQTITRERTYKPQVRNGFVQKDVAADIIPISVINRAKRDQMGKGFIRGTGITGGAVATTLIWDTGNILVIGSDEEDMAGAVNGLVRTQGGTVISKGGKIIYEFPMPLFGITSLRSLQEIAGKTKELGSRLKEIGTSLENPFLTIQTIPFTGLPFLRITDKGLADIKGRKLVPLFL